MNYKEDTMRVKAYKSTLGTIAVVLFAAGIAFAKFPVHLHSSQNSASVDIVDTLQIPNGPTLEPGSYKVTLSNDSSTPEVEFYRKGELVGQVPVKLVAQGKKINQTQIKTNTQDNGTQSITAIDLSGWTQEIVFGSSDESSSAGE
jgi:hypothetical protein